MFFNVMFPIFSIFVAPAYAERHIDGPARIRQHTASVCKYTVALDCGSSGSAIQVFHGNDCGDDLIAAVKEQLSTLTTEEMGPLYNRDWKESKDDKGVKKCSEEGKIAPSLGLATAAIKSGHYTVPIVKLYKRIKSAAPSAEVQIMAMATAGNRIASDKATDDAIYKMLFTTLKNELPETWQAKEEWFQTIPGTWEAFYEAEASRLGTEEATDQSDQGANFVSSGGASAQVSYLDAAYGDHLQYAFGQNKRLGCGTEDTTEHFIASATTLPGSNVPPDVSTFRVYVSFLTGDKCYPRKVKSSDSTQQELPPCKKRFEKNMKPDEIKKALNSEAGYMHLAGGMDQVRTNFYAWYRNCGDTTKKEELTLHCFGAPTPQRTSASKCMAEIMEFLFWDDQYLWLHMKLLSLEKNSVQTFKAAAQVRERNVELYGCDSKVGDGDASETCPRGTAIFGTEKGGLDQLFTDFLSKTKQKNVAVVEMNSQIHPFGGFWAQTFTAAMVSGLMKTKMYGDQLSGKHNHCELAGEVDWLMGAVGSAGTTVGQQGGPKLKELLADNTDKCPGNNYVVPSDDIEC